MDKSTLKSPPKPNGVSVNFNNIPLSLRDESIFVMWKYVLKDNKWTKPLYQINGRYAKTNDPNTWTSYESVKNAYETGNFDGIGILLTGDVVGIDLDHVIDDFEIEPWAEEILTQFKDTYIELSPSGEGFHILTYGKSRFTGKRGDKNRLEVYDHTSPRYFTITGQVYDAGSSAITENQDELDWLASKYDKMDDQLFQPQPHVENIQDEHSIIQAIINSKAKDNFNALNNGIGSDDQSANDLAFCNLLSYFTTDKSIIDSIFRKSKLMRDKWDEKHSADGKTYGEMTINKAFTGKSAKAGTEARACNPNIIDYINVNDIDVSNIDLEPFCDDLLNLPYGLGIIQDYILNQMPYPNRAMAGITAIAAMSLFSMKKITVDSYAGLGLNEQFLILAPTGQGKESLRIAIQKLYDDAQEEMEKRGLHTGNLSQLLNVDFSEIQYSMTASLQALHELLITNNAQFFMADEFAEWLTQTGSDSHKQGSLGYCMEIYTKALAWVNAPAASTKTREKVKHPRVTVFATSTAERMLEAMTSSQADSGALNRIIFFLAEQERIEKVYEGQIYEPSQECLDVILFAINQPNTKKVSFSAEAWNFYKLHDSKTIEPLKFKNNRFAGRLSEQALKLSALIAISDKRLIVEVDDIKTAYKIRENLYQRFDAFLQKNGGVDEMHVTARALQQLKACLTKKEYIAISQLNNRSRVYAKLSTNEQASVRRALLEEGIARQEGKRLYSNVRH
jgi:hypothetical protein